MSRFRKERVESMLAHEISTILFRKIQDPRVRGVHVVSVSVSNDYSSAHVFFSTLDETTDLEVVQQGLDSAKAFVRLELRKVIKMKITVKTGQIANQ